MKKIPKLDFEVIVFDSSITVGTRISNEKFGVQ